VRAAHRADGACQSCLMPPTGRGGGLIQTLGMSCAPGAGCSALGGCVPRPYERAAKQAHQACAVDCNLVPEYAENEQPGCPDQRGHPQPARERAHNNPLQCDSAPQLWGKARRPRELWTHSCIIKRTKDKVCA